MPSRTRSATLCRQVRSGSAAKSHFASPSNMARRADIANQIPERVQWLDDVAAWHRPLPVRPYRLAWCGGPGRTAYVLAAQTVSRTGLRYMDRWQCSSDLVRIVEEDHADLAIGPDRPTSDLVDRIALYDSPWVLWCSPDHALARRRRITWPMLKSEAVIAAGRGSRRRRSFESSPCSCRDAR